MEQLDHPGWRGKPVIVGGDPDRRGVVSTASYEARAYGVHSAMPSATARKRCPNAIWTAGNFGRYRAVSRTVMDILFRETPFVQQVSIDEAFADVSPTRHNREHPVLIARRIQQRVHELGITCSIGLGTTKSVAKVASDRDKPNGLTVVYPGREAAFLGPLPLGVMSGIGPVAQKKLQSYGMRTLGDVAAADHGMLNLVFGKNAEMMRNRCLGRDTDPVAEDEGVKSVSAEMSFDTDVDDRRMVEGTIGAMAAKVCRRLRRKQLKGSTVLVKVRFQELNIKTAQTRLDAPTDDEFVVTAALRGLLDKVWAPGMPLRLVGVAVSGFNEPPAPRQASLFDLLEGTEAGTEAPDGADGATQAAPSIPDAAKRRGLISATDKIRDRFGEDAVHFGREAHSLGHSTGSSAKNPEDYK